MTLEEVLKNLNGEKDLNIPKDEQVALAETLKMAMDAFGQTDKILKALNGDKETEISDESIEDVITTPANNLNDEDKK